LKPWTLFWLVSLGCLAQGQERPRTWIESQVLDRVQVTGWRRLGYHQRRVTGDTSAFDVAEYGGQGLSRFTDLGQIRIEGNRVFGIANFEANIQDSRFQDPQANRFSLDYERDGWNVNLGDIRGQINTGNRYAGFDKSLTGVQVGYRSKRFTASTVYSEVRGQPRTVSIQGANSAGPYYLQSSQIVRGSETIEIDGETQRFGEDYTIDYDLGSITFVNRETLRARIVPPTSTIVATYEVVGADGSAGKVQGVGMSYDFGKVGTVGVVGMRQVASGSGRESTRLEKFQGFGPPSTPYTLQFEPRDVREVVIRVNGVIQRLNVDYRFNSQNQAIFYFTRFMPPTDQIDVLYTPKAVQTVTGDREVVGLNYRLRLGPGDLSLYQATGRLTNTDSPLSGTAKGAEYRGRIGRAEFSASLREVPDGFVGIESTGFNRTEKASDLTLQYRASDTLTFSAGHRNSSVLAGTTGTRRTPIRFSSFQVSATESASEGKMPWRASHVRTSGLNPRGRTLIDTTSFGTSDRRGRWGWSVDLQNQFASGPTTVDGQVTQRKANLQSIVLRADTGSGPWTFDFGTTLSRIASGGESGLGRDVQFGLDYRPSDRTTFRVDYVDSDAGKLATLGFVSGVGAGYDGNSFSSGAGTDAFSGATNSRSLYATVIHDASDRLFLSANAGFNRSTGAVSSNAETFSAGMGATWRLGASSALEAQLDWSNTRFIGSGADSSAATFSLSGFGEVARRLSLRGSAAGLVTGGSDAFRQNNFAYEGSLAYLLAPRHNLVFSVRNGNTTGYLPQDSRDWSLTYQFQIWKSLALNLGYRVIDVFNRDPRVTSGAYSSRGFDIELEFNFGG
jgi:hypothetical protein